MTMPRKIKWNNLSYHEKLKKFHKHLYPKGACFGHAHTGKNALIATDLKSWVARQEVFEVGAPLSSQNPAKHATMKDIKKVARSLGVDIKESLKKSQTRQSSMDSADDDSSDDESDEPNPFYKLLEKYKLHDAINYFKQKSARETSDDDSDMDESNDDELSPKELKKQVDLANQTRSAFLSSADEKFSSERLERKHRTQKLKELSEKFSFIPTLCEIEDFSTQVALFQDGVKFSCLFDEVNRPRHQKEAGSFFNSLLSPVADQSLPVDEMYNMYTTRMLQILFDELEKLIKLDDSDLQTMEDEGEEKLDELPLAFVFHACNHTFTLGYSQQQKKWILIDSNQRPLKLIPGSELGYELFYASVCGLYRDIKSTHAEAQIKYFKENDEWILVSLKENPSSKPELNPIEYQVIQTLKNNLRTLHDLHLCLHAEIFVGSKIDPKLSNKIQQWMNSSTFKKLHKITRASTLILDDRTKLSLLNFAAFDGKIPLARAILNVNKTLLEHKDPLVNASAHGQTEMVAFLLSQGADPNAYSCGIPPVHCAANNGFLDVVKLLHEAKANLELTNESGATPLRLAYDHPRIVDYLLNEANVDPNSGRDFDSLYIAAQDGYIESVKLLLATGKVDINRKVSSTGFTSLGAAVDNGHWQVVELLLAAGANTATPEFSDQDRRDEYFKKLNHPEMQRVFKEHEARNKKEPEEKSQPKNNFSFFCSCRKRKERPQEEKSVLSHTAKYARISS